MPAWPSDEGPMDDGAHCKLSFDRLAVAVGEGAMAVRMIHERLESTRRLSSDQVQQPPTTNGELQHV